MELLERQPQLEQLRGWLAEAVAGRGRAVAVGGEAGAGKSALVSAFAAGCGPTVDVRQGACDPMSTPRPLGPLQDMMSTGCGGPLADALADSRPRTEIFPLTLATIRAADSPMLLVIEDAHWADHATYDLLRYVCRRVGDLPVLLLFTYRDDECGPDHPLRIVLGDLTGAPAMRRLHVPRLSPAAVDTIADRHGLDGAALYRITGGNPFFVSEVVAAAPAEIPDTVRDAVLARAHRLPAQARHLLEVVSAVPSRTERWLLAAVVGPRLPGLDACLAAGMLLDDGDGVRFRHELARLAVAGALPLGRRTDLHRGLVEALRAAAHPVDPARLAHHAAAAGDDEAVVEYATRAGRRAAEIGAHREAAAHYAAVLRRTTNLPPRRRAELLELRSYECYLTNELAASAQARQEALACWRQAGDALRIGDSLRWLSRLYWFLTRTEDAAAAGTAAVEVLEREPAGRELAMAYSNLAQLAMLADDTDGAVDWGARAARLGEELDEPDTVVHALNNIGSALANVGDPRGRELLERSLEGALKQNLEEHVARAYTNLMTTAMRSWQPRVAREYGAAGIAYSTERDLDSWRLYMIGWLGRLELDADNWAGAAAAANEVLRHRSGSPINRIVALVVLGLVRARRGDPEVAAVLDEALVLARQSGESQRLVPVAAALAEVAWLGGSTAAPPELAEALALEREIRLPWRHGEIAVWAMRFGMPTGAGGSHPDAPYTRSLGGSATEAVAGWLSLGCRYEAALAALDGDDVDLLRQAADWLRALGAAPALRRVSARLRELGSAGVRGARASTAANPAGLTAREVEVLALLAAGLPNAAIAAKLVLSPRTVDHHVSAVLRKLGAGSRVEAARAATRLGIAPAG
jgi:DNA-binding CsgD family transcriptional regulator